MQSRAIAAITAVWLLVCGVLSGQHEARVTHVRNSAGAYVHTSAGTGHHEGNTSDIHGQRDPRADHGECALLAAFHQAASAAVTCPTVVSTVVATHVQDTRGVAAVAVSAAVYRLAPKTSPPVAV